MEIHNQRNSLRPHVKTSSAGLSANEVNSGGAVDRSADSQPQRLLEGLRGNAEVRERLLVEITAKVAAGEYNTRVAAEQAAQSLVD
jgi:hypothetical protein